MQVLTLATLVYAAILVLALAASLVAILIHLVRIGRVLGDVHEALAEVDRQSEALQAPLEGLERAAAGAAAELVTAEKKVAAADEALGARLAPPQTASPAGGA